MSLDQILILCRKNLGNGAAMESSARLCLADAIALKDKGEFDYARGRAIKCLAYSVGVFHPDYQRASR